MDAPRPFIVDQEVTVSTTPITPNRTVPTHTGRRVIIRSARSILRDVATDPTHGLAGSDTEVGWSSRGGNHAARGHGGHGHPSRRSIQSGRGTNGQVNRAHRACRGASSVSRGSTA